jgi:hypothetical protein
MNLQPPAAEAALYRNCLFSVVGAAPFFRFSVIAPDGRVIQSRTVFPTPEAAASSARLFIDLMSHFWVGTTYELD